ncbi:adenylate isopentenyltransferase 7, mitochondrial-like [Neltuma alba]|uniref:adenylate isopentenyltransferase 7, mitochondrial-like n=1 Tax=Neltuma alba TaxID=207710 RepID=UPI0010A43052|nr:adenylate isopentenyltransferase 7, mitochondrial-like [Prosopis alba]
MTGKNDFSLIWVHPIVHVDVSTFEVKNVDVAVFDEASKPEFPATSERNVRFRDREDCILLSLKNAHSFHGSRRERGGVVMGAAGAGKSRLSIDLATLFLAQTINSDKMQVYEGFDIVTDKITKEDRRVAPHHLLGIEQRARPHLISQSALSVDALMPVLDHFLAKRVDQMLKSGMVDEVRPFFSPKGDYSRGIRKATGVPDELDQYDPFSNRIIY